MLNGLNITKGENAVLNVSKNAEGLTVIEIGCGWDAQTKSGGATIDVDIYAVALGDNGKTISPLDFVYFGSAKNREDKLANPSDSILHSGDNRTGEGTGYDETIQIITDKLPAGTKKIAIGAFIYQANEKGQNFGQIQNAVAAAIDGTTHQDLKKYDLTEDFSGATAIKLVEVYNHNGDWKYKAIGEGSKATISDIIQEYVV